MAEKEYNVVNTLLDGNPVVFTGCLKECEQIVINDKTGFLELDI